MTNDQTGARENVAPIARALPAYCYMMGFPYFRRAHIRVLAEVLFAHDISRADISDTPVNIAHQHVTRTMAARHDAITRTFPYLSADYNAKFSARIPLEYVLAIVIEASCYRETERIVAENNTSTNNADGSFLNTYSRCTSRISAHLDTPIDANDRDCLPHRLLCGTVNIATIGEINDAELYPQQTARVRELHELQLRQKVTKKTSSNFKCPKCHKKNVTIEKVQYRCLDEPANYRAECVQCHHNWTVA